MKNMSYLSTLAHLSFLIWSLATYGFSSVTNNIIPTELGSIGAPLLSKIEVSSSINEKTTENGEVDAGAESKKAKNCKDITTLESPSGLPRFLRTITGDRKLRPKDKVPTFTLPKVDGEEVLLYDVLEENEYVVIDFWATSCGPCIAKFPKWKKIYSTYKEHGLEIVSICLDLTHEDWEESSQEFELPWINLGEIEDEFLEGPTSKAFRLRSIPRSYLVDSDGCILHTHIYPVELESFLKSEYEAELKALEKNDESAILQTGRDDTDGVTQVER